ncbi:MAG: GNAT family N-acetyltransferase [Bacteroidaceae bacterium]|nr:GNAT family N-acetyltransferase [Bacteroidaceae bacterium]
MLKSSKLKLRAVEPEDLDLMYLIENDTELWPLGQASVPFSYYALKQYIAESSNDFFHDRQLRLVIETADEVSVGFVDLQNYDPLHHRAEVGIVVVPEQQRKGLATEALRLLAKYVSAHLGIHQLYALVPEGNEASVALFKKSGYKETATLQDWLNTPTGWQSVVVFQKVAPL